MYLFDKGSNKRDMTDEISELSGREAILSKLEGWFIVPKVSFTTAEKSGSVFLPEL